MENWKMYANFRNFASRLMLKVDDWWRVFKREHNYKIILTKFDKINFQKFLAPDNDAKTNRRCTPSLVGRQCWGKTILPGAGYGLGTYRTVDIFNFSHFSCPILEKLRFLCFYIIKSMARKGYFGPKSDFRGSKIPPRGARSTWNMLYYMGWQGGSGKVKIWHIWVISMGNVHKCISQI